jgi:hypothetical protein
MKSSFDTSHFDTPAIVARVGLLLSLLTLLPLPRCGAPG